MSDKDSNHSQDKTPDSVEKQHQKKPETSAEQNNEPQYLENSPDSAYKAKNPMMSTLPAAPHNEYDHFQSADDFRGHNTQKGFNPRGTLHGKSTDRSSFGMSHYARLSSNWNNRFHVSPSINNRKSHTFYKQFFDKPTRSTQFVALKPKKRLDPFLENETKSRIPAYSRVFKERPLAKELGWVDNFAVTHSKNNSNIHYKYKEFFDKPVSYNGAVTVATTKGVGDMMDKQKHQISTKKPTSTIHYLIEERGNRYTKHKDVQR